MDTGLGGPFPARGPSGAGSPRAGAAPPAAAGGGEGRARSPLPGRRQPGSGRATPAAAPEHRGGGAGTDLRQVPLRPAVPTRPRPRARRTPRTQARGRDLHLKGKGTSCRPARPRGPAAIRPRRCPAPAWPSGTERDRARGPAEPEQAPRPPWPGRWGPLPCTLPGRDSGDSPYPGRDTRSPAKQRVPPGLPPHLPASPLPNVAQGMRTAAARWGAFLSDMKTQTQSPHRGSLCCNREKKKKIRLEGVGDFVRGFSFTERVGREVPSPAAALAQPGCWEGDAPTQPELQVLAQGLLPAPWGGKGVPALEEATLTVRGWTTKPHSAPGNRSWWMFTRWILSPRRPATHVTPELAEVPVEERGV